MAEHAINGLMGVTMYKIRELVDSNTIIGNPINMDGGVTILPVSKVTFGVATGGSDFSGKGNKDLFGGGTGAGVTVSPVAFLVVKGGNVRTIQLADANNSLERAITMLPELVDKLGELLRKEKPADPAVEYTVEQPPVEA